MNSMSLFTDPVVSCPYDKFHRVALSKIQAHIVKCEKHYPVGYKKTCPYNATHRLFEHELKDHIRSCPQRRFIEPETYQSVDNHGSMMTDFIAQSIAESELDHGESWDEEFQEDSNQPGNININNSGASANLKDFDDPHISLRCPRGYSEVMMLGAESDVPTSDMESVVSVMGVGRGRINPKNIQLYKKFGRGGCLPKND